MTNSKSCDHTYACEGGAGGGGGRASADPERSIGRVGGVRARPGSPPLPPLRKGGKGATESAAEDISRQEEVFITPARGFSNPGKRPACPR